MTAARNPAVMAQRLIRDAKAFDFFATPPWGTRSLIERVLHPEKLLIVGSSPMTAWDPCCGAGHMAIPLGEYFADVLATDIHDWGFGDVRNLDFTMASKDNAPRRVGWVIGNPPFIHAERFLDRAFEIAEVGIAMLLRLQWIEGESRWLEIFGGDRRPDLFCPFAERLPMIEGCWDPEAKSATAYAWFVWMNGGLRLARRTEVLHIPPGQRRLLTRPRDEVLANRGEAARRRAARKLAEAA